MERKRGKPQLSTKTPRRKGSPWWAR
ncbi:hypothetical protein HU200_058748 [Digitaria exilis]|uniref:Uncharacterized protein n=1 Tax=Digitaria exilis TaxID=1010633 RepID=A0A835E0A2_9POAL|nr:hypothetical protein HU200_058748 [Digitaria exilis]